jgi:hypothetical protein
VSPCVTRAMRVSDADLSLCLSRLAVGAPASAGSAEAAARMLVCLDTVQQQLVAVGHHGAHDQTAGAVVVIQSRGLST